ncbi:N-acetylmuramoyl-L-alanine amidase family protein [Imhoffiella purpurea]|uniref:N-acetylmuramoyl-L-alanine amidase AmiC n=1 Tax=Imhoffiella purpurea TaxID=1249627 RepID=W9VAL2_9GAMM|nr:N-acetylmuramoyl-L-alanine amidase [Imhoffiella purpurea]EXJ16474.1 N-acetylmuramoyl-L-alanine amidase [Imhoffiella purpurea]
MNRVFVLLLLLISLPAAGAQVAVECERISTDQGGTRITLATSAAVSHEIFTLDAPDRVVIDIENARLSGDLPKARVNDPTLIGLRSGVRNQGDLRIVVDLKHPVRVKSFPMTGTGGRGRQLVVDLIPRGASGAPSHGRSVSVPSITASQASPALGVPKTREAIVAIDAGHGGQDPGAIGATGTKEKDVTLAIARKLEKLVEREPGMRPVMIRDGDYYVGLRQRIEKARQHNADIFISIHADAFNNPDAHGSSVYTLSQGAASSEAANWLANRENSADLIGGIDLAASDETLASVLLDMTQNATFEHSAEAANAVLSHLRGLGSVHKGSVQRAGFVVLKSPDIPSMLVETAFLSNKAEERHLKDTAHQQRLARAILSGVRSYFRKYPPHRLIAASAPGPDRGARISSAVAHRSYAAGAASKREYVICRGDTLSGIAQRYRVSISSLRAENGLQDEDLIRVGQVLSIPTGS